MANRKKRTRVPKWKEDLNEKKRQHKKDDNKKISSVPDEYKVIKKITVTVTKKNHYIDKSIITQKLHRYRCLHYFLKSFKLCNQYEECGIYREYSIKLKQLKDELIVDYMKAGMERLKSKNFRNKSYELKMEMLAHSVERMYYYGYFYTFDINIGREGFSWLTSCHDNYFIQVINKTKKYLTIRQNLRQRKIYFFENTNDAQSLDDHSVGSLVKGLKYTYSDMASDE